jgi:hypothetical protein
MPGVQSPSRNSPSGGRVQDKILRSADFQICCIADFQSAGRGIFNARRVGQRSADWKSAIQQDAILRYDRRILSCARRTLRADGSARGSLAGLGGPLI